jgi:hypothetical protein
MSAVSVRILRDPESPDWWLANFTFGDRSYTTQGTIIEEARYMAADLLRLAGADADTAVTFTLDDTETLSSVLVHPVTPSLIGESGDPAVTATS